MPLDDAPPPTETVFVILSLKYSGDWLMWWGPAQRGYVYDLDRAGRYTREDVDRYGLDDGVTKSAIPVRAAYAATSRAVRLDHIERMISDDEPAKAARAAIAEHMRDRR